MNNYRGKLFTLFFIYFFVVDSLTKKENTSWKTSVNTTNNRPGPSLKLSSSTTMSVLSSLKKPENTSANDKLAFTADCPPIMGNKTCHGYARKWIKFYLKIGGWGMLSVIAIGSLILISTQIFSKRLNYFYGNQHLQRIHLMEISAKYKLATV